MPISTRLGKLITDPLETRLAAAESSITTLNTSASDFVSNGADITLLNNNANYQTQTQVDSRINDLIGAAPAALDTLGEIASKLNADDSIAAAIIAVNTQQTNDIAANTSLLNTWIARLAIRRFNLTVNLTLTTSDVGVQHLINQTTSSKSVTLPSSPPVSQYFEIINSLSSSQPIMIATETLAPGDRYAVLWDGTEWVVM